ncbi:MAG: hypothetical protein ABSF26_23660 [Thermoguttaceae bacterium]|jgi:hypothetical protein
MNQIGINAEINFHEQEVLSIFHETSASDSDEKFAELAFAGAFAIRMISNLGTNQVTDVLAQHLRLIGRLIAEASRDLLTATPRIVPYPGTSGRKRFLSGLTLADHRMKLDFSQKGFGFLATGVLYYGPSAVHSLFRYFAGRRTEDGEYIMALANTANTCGEMQANRHIRLTNHVQLQAVLIKTCMQAFVPDWM